MFILLPSSTQNMSAKRVVCDNCRTAFRGNIFVASVFYRFRHSRLEVARDRETMTDSSELGAVTHLRRNRCPVATKEKHIYTCVISGGDLAAPSNVLQHLSLSLKPWRAKTRLSRDPAFDPLFPIHHPCVHVLFWVQSMGIEGSEMS